MSAPLNRVRMKTTDTGATGPIHLNGGAFSAAFMTAAESGAISGVQYTWVVEEGLDFMEFRGVYTSGSPDTVSVDQILHSKLSGTVGVTRMSLSGNAVIRVIQAAEDMLFKGQTIGKILALS